MLLRYMTSIYVDSKLYVHVLIIPRKLCVFGRGEGVGVTVFTLSFRMSEHPSFRPLRFDFWAGRGWGGVG